MQLRLSAARLCRLSVTVVPSVQDKRNHADPSGIL